MIRFFSILCLAVFFVKLFSITNTGFDLFGDEAQYWIWSQSLNFGYYSKPPLLAWIMGLFTSMFGNAFIILKAIPIIFYIFSSFVIFLISFELYNDKKLAFISALSFYLIPAVSVSSFLISTDIVLILFWSLSMLFVLKIRKNPFFINFLLLGIFVGLSFLSKYAAIYFIISLIVLLIIDSKLRQIFFKNIFYLLVSFLSFALIILPNIVWNFKNSWATFAHTSSNASLNKININILQGIEFILLQGLMLGPLLFFVFVLFIKKFKNSFENKFLLSFSLPVFTIILVESILVRANANWAAVGLVSFFILIFHHTYMNYKKIILLNNLINFVFCLSFFLLIAFNSSFSIFNRISGISSFANILDKNYLKEKDYIVVEDRMIYSNLRYLFRNNKKTFFVPYKPGETFSNHFQLTSPLPVFFKKNFIFLGNLESLDYLHNAKKTKLLELSEQGFVKQTIKIYEVTF